MSLSGAIGSLGGDFSCLSYNPAGLGMYQFTTKSLFSPSFSVNNTTSYNNKIILLENGVEKSDAYDEDISNGTIGNLATFHLILETMMIGQD